jgi:hypothetical protein
VQNSIQLMTELHDIPYTTNVWLASFDITNMYTNIPTTKVPHILTLACDQQNVTKKYTREIVKLTLILLNQNYFRFQDRIYRQREGLAMGAPTSSIFSELYLQYVEHTALYDILIRNRLLGYFRYVDDILLVYDTD